MLFFDADEICISFGLLKVQCVVYFLTSFSLFYVFSTYILCIFRMSLKTKFWKKKTCTFLLPCSNNNRKLSILFLKYAENNAIRKRRKFSSPGFSFIFLKFSVFLIFLFLLFLYSLLLSFLSTRTPGCYFLWTRFKCLKKSKINIEFFLKKSILNELCM